jgi:hypothetical protein
MPIYNLHWVLYRVRAHMRGGGRCYRPPRRLYFGLQLATRHNLIHPAHGAAEPQWQRQCSPRPREAYIHGRVVGGGGTREVSGARHAASRLLVAVAHILIAGPRGTRRILPASSGPARRRQALGRGAQNSTRNEGICCVVLVHGIGGGGATAAKSVANAASRGGVSGGGVGHGLDGGSVVRRRLGLSYPRGCSLLLQLRYPRGGGGHRPTSLDAQLSRAARPAPPCLQQADPLGYQ